MKLALLAVLFFAALAAAYRFYGRFVARALGLDDSRATPAHTRADGVDFVATPPFYLFAQHFSAIAAAGPIAGPILACQTFGWLPCLLWIGVGVVFIGAVHDFASLAASVRHGGTSVAEIARAHLGTPAGRAMMAFIWIALIYVIVAFTDITVGSFVTGTEELAAGSHSFNPGGAVAMASVSYLALSCLLGLVQRFLSPPLWLATVLFVPATFAVAWAGTHFSHVLEFDRITWGLVILGYCALASVTPVWALLQPRGYLGGFVLYSALAIGVVGILSCRYEIQAPAFRTFDAGTSTGALFPFLFVTIACGACSGFHGLVCSGTTSKQVSRESHMHFVGYGAMLAEAFVALIALVTVMIVMPGDLAGLQPGTIYGRGIGEFLTQWIGEDKRNFAVTFGAMAFSTFVFDTLDVCTRLGRYILEELFGWKTRAGALCATLITIGPPTLILCTSDAGAWKDYWTLFGASNQLLAGLTLVAITIWLRKGGRPTWFTLVPMVFVLSITLWALARIALASFAASAGLDAKLCNGLASAALIGLALFVVASALKRWREPLTAGP
jgi:carbon starvation protein